jgi:SAM-dependent methyltransferase
VSETATDQAFLKSDAYVDSSKLKARASIYDYRTPAGSLMQRVLDTVDWPSGSRVLDVGCGPGFYLKELRARDRLGNDSIVCIGVDLSEGMAREAAQWAPVVVADAARLSLADGVFDRVLAPHMLYHCPDIVAALKELRRVLRAGGVLIAVTNSADHLRELRTIRGEVARGSADPVSGRFSVENGRGFLGQVFDDISLTMMEGELRVPTVEPVIAYLESMMTWRDDPDATAKIAAIGHEVAAAIERDGVFRVRTSCGVFVCR